MVIVETIDSIKKWQEKNSTIEVEKFFVCCKMISAEHLIRKEDFFLHFGKAEYLLVWTSLPASCTSMRLPDIMENGSHK